MHKNKNQSLQLDGMNVGEPCPNCEEGELQEVEDPEDEEFEILCTHCGTGFHPDAQ